MASARRSRTNRQPSLAAIDAARVARGACRHCGGAVPCWSSFGDAKVGARWDEIPASERRELEQQLAERQRG